MSVRPINSSEDITYLSLEIMELSTQIGKIAGRAEEKGFPQYPIALKVDNQEVVLSHFEGAEKELRSIREAVDITYQRFDALSSYCASVSHTDIRKIFEQQIETLREQRGLLENSLRSFNSLLKAHLSLNDVESKLKETRETIIDYNVDNREYQKRLEAIDLEIRMILPFCKSTSQEFCNLHWEKKANLSKEVIVLKQMLNNLSKESEKITSTAEQILNKFKQLYDSEGKPVACLKIKQELYKAFQTLPSTLLDEVSQEISADALEKINVFEHIDQFTMLPTLKVVEKTFINVLEAHPSYRPQSMSLTQGQIEEESLSSDHVEQQIGENDLRSSKKKEEIPISASKANDFQWESGDIRKIVPGKTEVIQHGFNFSIPPPLKKTVIEVECKVPQGKLLYMSGNGPLGNWDKKVLLNRLGGDRWCLSFDDPLPEFAYKFRLDEAWEQGDNHTATAGEKYLLSSIRF
jgi:hypothetical protein